VNKCKSIAVTVHQYGEILRAAKWQWKSFNFLSKPRFVPTDQINMASATVRNGCITSPAVWGPSADSSRLEVRLHWRIRRWSWSASDWREEYESQPSADQGVGADFLGERWRRGWGLLDDTETFNTQQMQTLIRVAN